MVLGYLTCDKVETDSNCLSSWRMFAFEIEIGREWFDAKPLYTYESDTEGLKSCSSSKSLAIGYY